VQQFVLIGNFAILGFAIYSALFSVNNLRGKWLDLLRLMLHKVVSSELGKKHLVSYSVLASALDEQENLSWFSFL